MYAYNNFYNPYAQQGQPAPINNQYAIQQNGMQNQQHKVTHVTGRNGAWTRAGQLGPNGEDIAIDDTEPIVWLITTDGAGYPTLTPYNIAPAETQEQKAAAQYDALERRITSLEAIINEKSNARSAEPEQTVRTDNAV